MFMTSDEVKEMFKSSDPGYGRQNRRRGTISKRKRVLAKKARRRNRGTRKN